VDGHDQYVQGFSYVLACCKIGIPARQMAACVMPLQGSNLDLGDYFQLREQPTSIESAYEAHT